MLRISFLLSLALAFCTGIWAQEDLSTHFLRHTWQANRTNPAFFPEHKFIIGLPGVYNSLRATNITYGDLATRNENGEKVLDIDNAIGKLGPDNIIRENLDIETISLGLRLGKLSLSLGHMLRYNAFLNYPKTLPQLIWQGNAQFVGQEVSFGPDVDLYGYQEYALGLAGEILPGLTVGGRAKLLAGVGAIQTERHDLRLYTDSDIYQLQLTADLLANSAGSLQYDGFDKLSVNYNFGSFNPEELFTGNTGLAFDLGLALRLGRLELAASALDLGNVQWKKDVRNYSLKGVFEYEGLDLAQNIFEDSSSVGSVLDTLREIYDVVETNNSYQTQLPARYYFSGLYHVSEKLQLGALFYAENYRGEFSSAVALSANLGLLPFLNVGASYAYRSERYDNLGLNAAVKLGPVQVMAATDNIITAIRPEDSHSANVRLGLNLLFGSTDGSGGPGKGTDGFY